MISGFCVARWRRYCVAMSLDIFVFNFDRPYATVNDIPEGASRDLGSLAVVIEVFDSTFPGIQWETAEEGRSRTRGGPSVKGEWDGQHLGRFYLRVDDDPVNMVSINCHFGDEVMARLVELFVEQGWQAIDTGSGDLIDLTAGTGTTISTWNDFLARAVQRANHDAK